MKLRPKYGISMDNASVETTGMNEWKYFIKPSVTKGVGANVGYQGGAGLTPQVIHDSPDLEG